MGGVFVKKWKIGGVFFVKVENSFFVKKWKMGMQKSGYFLNAGCIMYSISIFYFTFYFFGGAYAPSAPPCLRACLRLPSQLQGLIAP